MALSIEQIAEAAQSLRDDPTFASMSVPERHIEAKFLVDVFGGDGADIHAVVDWATGLDATPPARGAQFRPHIPAQAAAAAQPQPVAATPPIVAPPQPPSEKSRPGAPQPVRANGKLAPDMGVNAVYPLLHQIKAASGGTDRDFSALLGVPRSTVQAYLCGRIAESYTAEQFGELLSYTKRAQVLLTEAERTITASLLRFS